MLQLRDFCELTFKTFLKQAKRQVCNFGFIMLRLYVQLMLENVAHSSGTVTAHIFHAIFRFHMSRDCGFLKLFWCFGIFEHLECLQSSKTCLTLAVFTGGTSPCLVVIYCRCNVKLVC